MFDYVVHSKIRIAARPAAIWPHIATLDWMSSPRLESIGGTPGGVGERFEAYGDDGLETILFYVANVEMIPEIRRTVRMDGLDGVPMGFTSFELIPDGEETIVAYDLYCRMPLPDGQSTEEALALGHRGSDEALLQLQALVEGGHLQASAR